MHFWGELINGTGQLSCGVCVCVCVCVKERLETSKKLPDGALKLTSVTNLRKRMVTFTRYSKVMFHYMFKAEFVTLVSSKVSSGASENTKKRGFFF